MKRFVTGAALSLVLVLPACGGAPNQSLFPGARPASDSAVGASVQPSERPRGLARLFGGRKKEEEVVSNSPYGAICGDPSIRGETIAPITSATPGCGVANAVAVYEVEGVALSTPARINCGTASAFKTWVRQGAIPAVGKRGGGIESFKVAASYACRTRNHQAGARISEHGKGNAIDISEIRLKDGSKITLLDGWRDPKDGKVLRQMHRKACGPFGTVLGPESDRWHQDHFHFDIAQHRGGAYCR